MKQLFQKVINYIDNFNPVVIKECRQYVRNPANITFFLIELIALLLLTSFLIISPSEDTMDKTALTVLTFSIILIIGVCIIMNSSLRTINEWGTTKDQDLMFITTLSPTTFVNGKIISNMIFCLFIIMAGTPFFSIGYIIGNISLATLIAYFIYLMIIFFVLSSIFTFSSLLFLPKIIKIIIGIFILKFFVFYFFALFVAHSINHRSSSISELINLPKIIQKMMSLDCELSLLAAALILFINIIFIGFLFKNASIFLASKNIVKRSFNYRKNILIHILFFIANLIATSFLVDKVKDINLCFILIFLNIIVTIFLSGIMIIAPVYNENTYLIPQNIKSKLTFFYSNTIFSRSVFTLSLFIFSPIIFDSFFHIVNKISPTSGIINDEVSFVVTFCFFFLLYLFTYTVLSQVISHIFLLKKKKVNPLITFIILIVTFGFIETIFLMVASSTIIEKNPIYFPLFFSQIIQTIIDAEENNVAMIGSLDTYCSLLFIVQFTTIAVLLFILKLLSNKTKKNCL